MGPQSLTFIGITNERHSRVLIIGASHFVHWHQVFVVYHNFGGRHWTKQKQTIEFRKSLDAQANVTKPSAFCFVWRVCVCTRTKQLFAIGKSGN